MPASNSAWGIEIGSGGIKAVKMTVDGDVPRVTDFIAIEHPKVLSTPDVDKDDVLRVSLGRLVNERDLSGAAILVSIPGHQSFARFAKLPPVEPKKIPDIVKFEAVQQVPFPLDEVEWDYQTFVSPDSPEVEVGIFAVTKDRVKQQLDMLADVGIQPDGLTLSPLAVFNALAHDLQFTEKSQGTIILDIGTTATDLIISEAGRVWIRTFPMGGHNFTSRLVEEFKIGYAKAEKLKREADQSQHARNILQAMRTVFADLGQDVQRSIGYYQSLHKDANLTRLIGLGGTFHLPGLRKYLKQQLGMEVYRLEEWKRANLADLGDKTDDFQAKSMEMATAYGLALQGVGLQTIDANLIPATAVREVMWRRKVKWFGVAAGIGLVAAGAMFVRPILDQQAISAAANDAPTHNTIRTAINRAQSLKADAEAQQTTGQAQVDPRASRVAALLSGRDAYTHLLADVSAMLEDAERVRPGFVEANAVSPDPQGPAWAVESIRTVFLPHGRFAPEQGTGMPTEIQFPDAKRIEVTMEIVTWMPQHERFWLASIQRWIEDNAERPGLPYRLMRLGNARHIVIRGSAGGSTVAQGPDRDPETIAPQPGGRRRQQDGSHPDYSQEEIQRTMRQLQAEGIARGDMITGGGGADTSADTAETQGLDGLAPLEAPKANEGLDRATYTVRWVMIFEPVPPTEQPEQPAGQDGEQPAGEGGGL